LFNLDEFESAKASFEEAIRLDPSSSQAKTWLRKCRAELNEEGEADESKPPAPAPQPIPAAASTSNGTSDNTKPIAPCAIPAPEAKYRHQFYQMQNKVTIDVYAKNIDKDRVSCNFTDCLLAFSIKASDPGSSEPEYTLDVDLYSKIVPSECKFEVLKSKIEITLVKADSHVAWASLEKSSKIAAPNYSTPGTTVPAQYPTSTKNKKDWSKVDSEISELEKKGELDDGDPLNAFFKKIFAGGDEDTRRAMMKSFQESNGTVLSTNWSEIGQKKTECTPPDGMEVKKYEL
jgi:suppressor of G2 allele of SKP1